MVKKTQISLRGLRTFCVAARYESFRTAADELFITSSAVSHQIKSLEEELGEPLFDRTGRELSLTETGKSLYEDVSPLIEQLNSVVAKYKHGATSSSVRISVQPFFASEYFVPRLSEFTAEHPEIDIQVGTSDESAEKHPLGCRSVDSIISRAASEYAFEPVVPIALGAGRFSGVQEEDKGQRQENRQRISDHHSRISSESLESVGESCTHGAS